MVVTQPFIGIDLNANQSEGMDVMFESFLVSVANHPQTNLTTLTPYRTHNRWTIIVISPMAALFVSPAARGIIRIGVILTFFPPHSETFRRFQSVYRVRALVVDGVGHWLATAYEHREPFDGKPQSRGLSPR